MSTEKKSGLLDMLMSKVTLQVLVTSLLVRLSLVGLLPLKVVARVVYR